MTLQLNANAQPFTTLDLIAPNAAALKRNYNGYLARALVVAALVHLAGIGTYWAYAAAYTAPYGPVSKQLTILDPIGPITPPLNPTQPNPGLPAPPSAPVPGGVPTPVPEDEAGDETVPTQEDLSEAGNGRQGDVGSPGGMEGGTGTREAYVPPTPGGPPSLPPAPPTVEDTPEAVETPPVFEFAEVMPELVGGMTGLQASISYPRLEREAGIEGRVIVGFVVDETGRAFDVRVVRSASAGLDRAAVEAVQRARFTPGQQNGRPVKVRLTIPVSFTLN